MSNIDKQKLRLKAVMAGGEEWQSRKMPGELYEYTVIVKGSLEKGQGWSTCRPVANEVVDKKIMEFIAAANPATVLALLDELEAKDRKLNEILTPNMLLPVIDDLDEDNLRHVIKTVCENYSLLHAKWEAAGDRAEAAEKRIAELEAPAPELKMAHLINKFYERYPLAEFKIDTERSAALGYFMAGAELQCFGEFINYAELMGDE
ncbi:ead/Ea22-like family protein [Enterobacter bugandensis]|uniref:ead/Ea22-like family protein n=1 Tax=Enterobacter bugandensis TaxID=881260 RepID=UPI0018FF0C39|nr:ead/Ea22-like family protein [Enterobacter bugandensis]MBG0678289.1 ead/Ea22-like family protein [Enterobacter bugandensis]